MRTVTTITFIATFAWTAHAQPIDPANSVCWSENTGHINFAGAEDGASEVFAFSDHLEGFAWGENIGWVNLGSGPGPYPNTTGLDFGVNRDPITGEFSGFAWSENCGWINFAGGALASPPNPARIESGRFRGYVWGENIGWVNLDDDDTFVALIECPPDLNNDGSLDFFDVSTLLTGEIDYNGDTSFDFFDISLFLQDFGAGCP